MKKIAIFIFLGWSLFANSQIQLSKDAQASILTCGNGDQLYSVFGHTGIRIWDASQNIDLVYNYGTFDFNTPNFYLKFVKGDLEYQLSVASFNDFMYEYQYTNRDVFQQKLKLSSIEVQKLYDLLNNEYFSDKKKYIYKFIGKNCTSKTNDKINEILGAAIINKVDDKTISYRQVINPFLKDNYWAKLGINAIFGYRVDKPATKLFLPIELLNSLETTDFKTEKVVLEKEILNKATPQEAKIPWWNNAWVLIVILIFLTLIGNQKIIITSLSLLGILGLFFASVGLYSLHQEILWNYNVLLFNPLYFVLICFFYKKNLKMFNIISNIIRLLLLIYVIYLIYINNIILFLPLILFVLIMLYKLKKIAVIK